MPSAHEIPDPLTYKDTYKENIVTVVERSELKNDKYTCMHVFKDGNDVKIFGALDGKKDDETNGEIKKINDNTIKIKEEKKEKKKGKEKTQKIWTFSGNSPQAYLSSQYVSIPYNIISACYLGNGYGIALATGTDIIIVDNELTNPKFLKGHTDWVFSVCNLGDGKLASASYDETVRVWDAASGACLRVLEGHTDWVRSVTAVGNGRLASASWDRTVRVWDAASGACLHVLKGHKSYVSSVCAVEYQQLASASGDSTVRVWDAVSGVCLRILEGHVGSVNSVTYLGNGRLASASLDGTVRVWDLKETEATPKLLKLNFSGYEGRVSLVVSSGNSTGSVSDALPRIKKIQAVPGNENQFIILFSNKILLCDITDLENFPKPNRSGILHRIQNFVRKQVPFKYKNKLPGKQALPAATSKSAGSTPPPRMGGRLSRKKRMVKRKSRKLKNLGDKNNFK